MKTAGELLVEKGQEIITVSPNTTIFEAVKTMVVNNIGAILIEDDGDIKGIWTERDLLKSSATHNFDPHTAAIKDHMNTNLQSVDYTSTMDQLLDKFLGMRVRHLLITREDKFIGILSSGDVSRVSLNERSEELKQLNEMVSWEYYENWRFKKK